jgi:hypothetical protein
MADFPPAQYIDGYTATGNTISFTIDGYTGKKVASVSVTNGGSYTTPTASVAFSGGSGTGASATANMGLKGIAFSSIGASSLLQTSSPTSVSISTTGGATTTPLFGVASVSPNTDLFFDASTTPTVAVSGDNGAYTDSVISIDHTTSLHVASLTTPTTGGGSYRTDDDSSVQIVNASNTNISLGTATISADSEGNISSSTVVLNSWNTAQTKNTLNGYSLKLKSIEPSFDFTFSGTNTNLFFKTLTDVPSFSILNQSPYYQSDAGFIVNKDSCTPSLLLNADDGQIYSALGNVNIVRESNGLNGEVVGSMTSGTAVTWTAGNMTWNAVNQQVTYRTVSPSNTDPNVYINRVVIGGAKQNGTLIQWDNKGRYDTNALSFTFINLYSNNTCTNIATQSNINYTVVASTSAQISTSSFAIKAFKMPLSTASSRLAVSNEGNGYADAIQVQSTGLKTEAGLLNDAGNNQFNKVMLLKEASVLNSGSVYTSAPTVTASGGGIINTNVVKTLTYSVNSVTIANAGLGYATSPTVAISGSVSAGGANSTAISTISTNPAISLPNLAGSEADPTTGDFREVCHALCELANNIDTQSMRSSLQTTLQSNGIGVIDKFTFVFDLVPETGVLTIDPEP